MSSQKVWLIVHPVTHVIVEACFGDEPRMSSGEEIPEGFTAVHVPFDEAVISRRQLVERR